jgi:F0F1-type ATP synthase beta subunit
VGLQKYYYSTIMSNPIIDSELRAHGEEIEKLRQKYGRLLSIIEVLCIDEQLEDDRTQSHVSVHLTGSNRDIHALCHVLLEHSAAFVEEIINAIACVLDHSQSNLPEKVKMSRDICLKLIKRDLLKCNREYQKLKAEKEAQDLVDSFVKEVFEN